MRPCAHEGLVSLVTAHWPLPGPCTPTPNHKRSYKVTSSRP
jgi:hypothetical protein